jgi:hypothetical protein
VAEPDVTPLTGDAAVGLGWTADALRALRAGRVVGLIRFGGGLSGDVTVTGGSCAGVTAATVCASAGDATTNSDAAAENIRQTTTRNADAPA